MIHQIMRAIVLVLLLCWAMPASAGPLGFFGRSNRSSSTVCNCEMCQRNRAVARQRTVTSTRVISQPAPQLVSYRTEWQKFGCETGVCQYRQVRVPVYGTAVASPAAVVIHDRPTVAVPPSLSPTPHDVIASILSIVKPRRGSTWVDAGSGDGRVVIAAAQAGCNAIGIEISQSRVDSSRSAIEATGGQVLRMDATQYDYRYADYVFLYQHAPVIAKVVAKLRPYATIISYQHRIPGMQNRMFRRASDGATFYVAVKPDGTKFNEVTQ